MSDLVKRLRALRVLDEVGSDNPLGREAADRIEVLEEFVKKVRAIPMRRELLPHALSKALTELDNKTG